MSFVSSNSCFYSDSVMAVMCAISCYIGSHYNCTWLYYPSALSLSQVSGTRSMKGYVQIWSTGTQSSNEFQWPGNDIEIFFLLDILFWHIFFLFRHCKFLPGNMWMSDMMLYSLSDLTRVRMSQNNSYANANWWHVSKIMWVNKLFFFSAGEVRGWSIKPWTT